MSYDNMVIEQMYPYMNGAGYLPWTLQIGVKAGSTTTPQMITFDGGNIVTTPSLISYNSPEMVLIDEIWFHCDSDTPVNDVTVLLTSGGINVVNPDTMDLSTIPAGTILDTLIIHQIPEPMTMALLGLGGLALIRRRR